MARACDGCLRGKFAALITGPVHKGIINDAGVPFTGDNYQRLFPASMLGGGLLLLLTDTLARSLFTIELPLGILTALIGGHDLHRAIHHIAAYLHDYR